jgi:nucleoside-diphosphate-sugar epimerase
MKIFITGGTGFIGNRLTEKLASLDNEILLLVRNPDKKGWFDAPNVSVIKGDLFSKSILSEGMKNCDVVYHLAALTSPWSKDPSLSFRTNAEGTANVLEAALECGVRKVIVTSTGGTLSFSTDGKPVDESSALRERYNTEYESTKAEAEKRVKGFTQRGLNISIVNPTRVYGPGKLSVSNSMTRIIDWYSRGLWRFMPGNGSAIGNYVFIDDVVSGMILAAEKGRPGERYILGGENISFRRLFRLTGEAAGKTRLIIYIAAPVLKGVISILAFFSKLFGKTPFITNDWLDKYMKNWIVSGGKAERDLGYKITSFSDGVKLTLDWLQKQRVNGK